MRNRRCTATPKIMGWTGIMSDIAKLFGDEIAVKFCISFGGTQLHFPLPSYIREDHPIASSIGMNNAVKMAELFHGERHHIPTATLALRVNNIKIMHENGWNHSQIARALRVDRSMVRRHVGHSTRKMDVPRVVNIICPFCGECHRMVPRQGGPRTGTQG